MKTVKFFALFFLLSGIFSYLNAQINEETIIKGKLINIENIDEVYLKHLNKTDTVFLDNNSFKTNLKINQPQYLYFTVGLDEYPVFIFPGNIVNIELEKIKKLEFKITYNIQNSVYADYFNLVNNTSNSFSNDSNFTKNDFELRYHKIDTVYNINTGIYNNFILTNSNLNDNFISLEPLRLFFFYKSQVLILYSLSSLFPTNEMQPYNDSVYKSVSGNTNLDNAELLQLDECKLFITTHYSFKMTTFMFSKMKNADNDEEKALAIDLSMLETFKNIDADFSSFEIKDYLKYFFLSMYMPYMNNMMLDSSYNYFLKTCKNQKYIDNLNGFERQKKENLTGKQAPNFSGNDINGKKYTLSDFKGKYIFIDFWATWCEPCRKETPDMIALFERYKDNKDIVIISLSIDEETDKWKQVTKDEKMNWLQLNTTSDSKFLEEYQVDGIPKFVLIDKEGKIINPDAPRPSNEELTKLLDKYLKENK